MTHATVRPVSTVELYYTTNAATVPVVWKPIRGSADPLDGNPGSYEWTVPTLSKQKNKCRVMVVLKDAAGKKVGSVLSNGDFTIGPK
jgi:hypothetical protein